MHQKQYKFKNTMQKNSAEQLVYKYKVNIGVEIDKYKCKLLMLNIYQIRIIKVAIKKTFFHSYISNDNEQDACESHDLIFHLLKTF